MRFAFPQHDVVGIRAENPSPFTLGGTNTWLVGRDPAWLIDPGPALPEHVEAVAAEVSARGGLGGIALTHDHADHAEAVPALRGQVGPVPVAAARGAVEVTLGEGDRFGPLEALRTPGHATDHLAFVLGEVAFTGDAVLGEGSVFVWPYPGALTEYLAGLGRLGSRRLSLLCPGHGPPVADPAAKLREYIAHRLDRERRLLAALDRGSRTMDELLDQVWDDAPPALRPAAAWTLAAHLDKLEQEGRLPAGVERPELTVPGAAEPGPPPRPAA
jgi:glyoxylase-like metal-dependent hydrolase (beta-lactamase superfamily II)